jgi:hypothetical protein
VNVFTSRSGETEAPTVPGRLVRGLTSPVDARATIGAVRCARCRDRRWICVTHPWRPHEHDGCRDEGEPCPECQDVNAPELPAAWASLASTSSAQTSAPCAHQWTLHKNGRQIDCALLFHGESYGWEVRFLYDGELAYGQRFVLKAGALAEADAQHSRLEREGWRPIESSRDD